MNSSRRGFLKVALGSLAGASLLGANYILPSLKKYREIESIKYDYYGKSLFGAQGFELQSKEKIVLSIKSDYESGKTVLLNGLLYSVTELELIRRSSGFIKESE